MTYERQMEIKKDYSEELAEARIFVMEHKDEEVYQKFIHRILPIVDDLIHSDIWSMVYDFINEYYPSYSKGKVITGLAYLIEM